jgi:hypothetical protein
VRPLETRIQPRWPQLDGLGAYRIGRHKATGCRGAISTARTQERRSEVVADDMATGAGRAAHVHGTGADHLADCGDDPFGHADHGRTGADRPRGGDARGECAVRALATAQSAACLAAVVLARGAASGIRR